VTITRQVSFLVTLLTFILILVSIRNARSGRLPEIRKIPGLEAIDEVVGRATEMGRPVICIPGSGDVVDSSAVQTLAGLAIMQHVAHRAAAMGARLLVSVKWPNVYPLVLEQLRQAYLAEGKIEAFQPMEQVYFVTQEQMAYILATLGIMQREKVAGAVLTGFFQADSLLMAEGAAQAGAVTIAGTTRTYQIPFFVAACDYVLLGDELLVSGAYLSKDPVKLGSVQALDYLKVLAIAIIGIGALLATGGLEKPLVKLLKM